MREAHVTLPELALVAGTRAALGGGLGLLLADRLSAEQRRAIGWTLLMLRRRHHYSVGVRDSWQATLRRPGLAGADRERGEVGRKRSLWSTVRIPDRLILSS